MILTGWLCKMSLTNDSEFKELMSEEAYLKHCEGEEECVPFPKSSRRLYMLVSYAHIFLCAQSLSNFTERLSYYTDTTSQLMRKKRRQSCAPRKLSRRSNT